MSGGEAEPPAPAVGLEGAEEAPDGGGGGEEHGGVAAHFDAPALVPWVDGDDEASGEAGAGVAEGGSDEAGEGDGEEAAEPWEEAEVAFDEGFGVVP